MTETIYPTPLTKGDLEMLSRRDHMGCIDPDCDGVDISDAFSPVMVRIKWNEHVRGKHNNDHGKAILQ